MSSWFTSRSQTLPVTTTAAPAGRPNNAHLAALVERDQNDSPDSLAESVTTTTPLATPRPAVPRSFTPPSGPASAPVFDPFSGVLLGDIVPPNGSAREANEEELWLRLTQITSIQSKIAEMHGKMEGLGTRTKPAHRRTTSSNGVDLPRRSHDGQSHSLDSGIDDGGDDDVDEEAEENRRRDEEFLRLGTRFEGRTEAVQEVWDSLDQLSSALKAFHALQTPKINIKPSSRIQTTSSPRPTKSPAFGKRPSSPLASTLPSATMPQSQFLKPSFHQDGKGDILAKGLPLSESPTDLTPTDEPDHVKL